jgi:SPX domain
MVDFGLKLEDNKVSDWNEYYIQYEKLKLILKQCENAIKTYNELVQCRPETAAIIIEKYERGDEITTTGTTTEGVVATTPTTTSLLATTQLENLIEIDDNNSECRTVSSCGSLQYLSNDNIAIDEKNDIAAAAKVRKNQSKDANTTATAPMTSLRLTEATMPDYGTSGTIKDSVNSDLYSTGSLRLDNNNENIISRALKKATSNVSDYYSSRYEKKLYNSLKLITKYETEFDNLLHYNISLVNTFYTQKVHEIHDQLFYLRESVQPSAATTKIVPTGTSTCSNSDVPSTTLVTTSSSLSDNEPTPLITSRKKHMTSASPIFLVKKNCVNICDTSSTSKTYIIW